MVNDKFNEILTILAQGGIILFPTDTLWAIGCDATNGNAIAKLKTIKNVKDIDFKGFVTIVENIEMLRQSVEKIHPRIETLLAYHNRPLTVVYDTPLSKAVLPAACAPNGSAAIRITHDPFCKNLIHLFGKPLVASCACLENANAPRYFGEISSDILENVDYIVKYRHDERNTEALPSPIIQLDENEELLFLRD